MVSRTQFEGLLQDAHADVDVGTRLNQLDPGGGATVPLPDGYDELTVVDGTLSGAASLIAEFLLPETGSAGETADVQMSVAASSFREWDMAHGLASVIDRWGRKIDLLTGALETDAEALDAAQLSFRITEHGVRYSVDALADEAAS